MNPLLNLAVAFLTAMPTATNSTPAGSPTITGRHENVTASQYYHRASRPTRPARILGFAPWSCTRSRGGSVANFTPTFD